MIEDDFRLKMAVSRDVEVFRGRGLYILKGIVQLYPFAQLCNNYLCRIIGEGRRSVGLGRSYLAKKRSYRY